MVGEEGVVGSEVDMGDDGDDMRESVEETARKRRVDRGKWKMKKEKKDFRNRVDHVPVDAAVCHKR